MPESPPRRRRATREDPPLPSLAKISEHARGIVLLCGSCGHSVGFAMPAIISLAGEREDIEGLRRRVLCTSCGTRGASTTIAWAMQPGWGIGYMERVPRSGE